MDEKFIVGAVINGGFAVFCYLLLRVVVKDMKEVTTALSTLTKEIALLVEQHRKATGP